MQAAPVASRIALRNILLATDFSEVSKTALPFALDLARWFDGKIFVTRVVPYDPYLAAPIEPIPIDLDLSWKREEQNMADFVSAACFGNVAHEEVLLRGELGEAINDLLGREHVDVAVVGTHGRQGFSKLMLGSAAEKIYRQARCPVLTIGPEAVKHCRQPWELKRVLFPTDFAETSLHALPYALSLAEEKQATLIFLHAIPLVPQDYKESVELGVSKRLENLMPAEPWCNPEFAVNFDFPAPAIVNMAREHNAALIVMGVGRPAVAALKAHQPWSIASDVVGTAPCPVLTVRQS